MKLSTEQLALVQQCSSAEELYAKAQEAGFELTEEEAETLYKKFEYRTLDVEDLSFVSGGGCFTIEISAKCDICGTFSENYHSYTDPSFPNEMGTPVCDACYQLHKNDSDKYWVK